MYLFDIICVAFAGAIWLFVAIANALLSSKKYSRWAQLLRAVASLLMIYGATGFFGSAFSSSGGLNWANESLEWPIGRASGVIKVQEGYFVVPHGPSSRIQVYDNNRSFIRGWHVDANGGFFRIATADGHTIDVFAVRPMKHYRYSVEGMLLSEDKCTIDEYDEYIKRIDDGQSIWIPTHWWLLPFTNPFYSWVLAGTGLVTLMLADKYAKSNGDTNAVDFSDANPST